MFNKLSKTVSLSLYLSLFLVRSCLLITLIKCLKGHKSLGSLFEGVLLMYLSLSLSLSMSDIVTYWAVQTVSGQLIRRHHILVSTQNHFCRSVGITHILDIYQSEARMTSFAKWISILIQNLQYISVSLPTVLPKPQGQVDLQHLSALFAGFDARPLDHSQSLF